MIRCLTSLICALLLLAEVGPIYGAPIHSSRTLLAAIDVPLTPSLLLTHGVRRADLEHLIDQPREQLYVRARAISALAMLQVDGYEERLSNICRGPYPVVLKQQAIVSLARVWGQTHPIQTMDTLLQLMGERGGALENTIAKELFNLQKRVSLLRVD